MARGPDRLRLRVAFLGVVTLSLLSAIVLRLWFLQVLAADTYVQAAEENRVRIVPIEPARGRILDRNGEVLVRNRPSLVVAVRPDELQDRQATLERLGALLEVPLEKIEERLADKRVLPYAAIPVAKDVPESVVIYILEHREQFPGVVAETRPVRVYPKGSTAAHILGYTGEITAEQLDQPRYQGYRPGSIAGRSGIEYAYERDLHGADGLVKLQVDAAGRVKGEPLGQQEPKPGLDVVTSIDARIQALVEESLALGLERARTIFDRESQKRYLAPAGGAVVMDPRNGEVLALASFPAYDPGLFVGGISRADFDALNGDPTKPLINRATQAQFPPGSTFKVITAAAALQDGIASRNGRYDCPPSVRLYDRTFRNWKSSHSGMISLPQALVESCDTVFYDFGAEFWRRFRRDEGERLQDVAREFGFGARTGIEIEESPGRVPDDRWLKTVHARAPEAFPYDLWLPGYTINMSIGQGDLIVTPLQLANSYAAIANGGTLYKPRVGLKVLDGEREVRVVAPEKMRDVAVSAPHLETIRRGLDGVATSGTARGAFLGFPLSTVPIAAKTGTADVQSIPRKQPYAWFVAYAPARDPQYVVAVMLEEAGHGGETAGPVARRILEGIFELPLSDVTPAPRTD